MSLSKYTLLYVPPLCACVRVWLLPVSKSTAMPFTAACGAWVQLPVPHHSPFLLRRRLRVSMATRWLTASSLFAWAPSRQSTSTTTRPSPSSPTKLHLSSSRKSLPESTSSQSGAKPFWSLRWHRPHPPATVFAPVIISFVNPGQANSSW